jgi:hypothetical protein
MEGRGGNQMGELGRKVVDQNGERSVQTAHDCPVEVWITSGSVELADAAIMFSVDIPEQIIWGQ